MASIHTVGSTISTAKAGKVRRAEDRKVYKSGLTGRDFREFAGRYSKDAFLELAQSAEVPAPDAAAIWNRVHPDDLM